MPAHSPFEQRYSESVPDDAMLIDMLPTQTAVCPDSERTRLVRPQPSPSAVSCRLIRRSGGGRKLNVTRKHVPFTSVLDLYHTVLDLQWYKVFLLIAIYFVVVNLVFAALYYAVLHATTQPDGDGGVTFWQCFFFSVQTMQTIGYGHIEPSSFGVDLLICLASYVSMLDTALVMGIVFAKISRPSRLARQVMFSEVAVVNWVTRCYADGRYSNAADYPSLVFRLANLRKSQLCNTALRLLLLRRELDSCTPAVAIASAECQCDGKQQQAPRLPASVYRMHELAFEINDQIGRVRDLNLSVPALGLPWTVVHTMDKSSPLYGATLESLARCEAELIVIFDGTDEGCSDTIQARWSYTAAELRWNEAFVPIVRAADGTFEVDFARFSDTQPVPLSHLLLTGSLS
eukprot:TRINITY_DN1298_c1_g1_i6.p2 TRINITY_DN1298_c1_g1~~TRINITY_DN1298_c1_g1_i6.p2  ORF type:complete len:402 (-),score=159.73 TRINITY_DN1298_c1_g1_i6:238-1443(-)